jgi:hypothetical protein
MAEASAKIVNRPAAPVRPVVTTSAERTSTSPLPADSASPLRSPNTLTLPSNAARIANPLLDRIYRMTTGQLIELPPDMSAQEAAKLEAEALAAQARLGKGPGPQPVDIESKPAPKKEAKGEDGQAGKKAAKKSGAARRKMVGRSAAMKARLPEFGGKTAAYLLAKGRPALALGARKLATLSQNERTHDDANQKLKQSEIAVVNPASENQSRSNASQIAEVEKRPPPPVDANKGKATLRESLRRNTPRSIEDVDNFKRDLKGQHIGADVLAVTQQDTNAVLGTFSAMQATPPPAPPQQVPVALPPPEVAPGTAALDLGRQAIAPLQPEHTDVSKFTAQADAKLVEEGVTQEQLDMVDSGDLAAANKEKQGMAKMAATEPAAIRKFSQVETTKVETSLKQSENVSRHAMVSRRKNGLGATGKKQQATKSAFEKKREEVGTTINKIFKTAQDSVKKKLADLETQSMKRFDDGNAKATREFENDVKREIDAFKSDRYSGMFGWARKAKDWLLGMEDLPAVKAIFERNRTSFVSKVEALTDAIGAENKRVIAGCKQELAQAKASVQSYVDSLGPDLKKIGQKAAQEVNAELEAMDGLIAKKEEELAQQLADKQKNAIKAIDEKIEKMKDAMSGALSKLGKLLLYAAKKFFTWALSKFGYSLNDIENIISKGAAVLKAIFTKPIVFVKNLMRAAITGFENFGANFLKHLKDALFEWLTGSLEGVKVPRAWTFQAIIGLALEIIGVSYANLRKHLVAVMDEGTVTGLEKTFGVVKTLVTEGPMAAWEELKSIAKDLGDAFLGAVKDFIKTKIVEQAVIWLVSLFVPGAGIVKAIIGIYDTIVFFIQKAKQIAKMVANFLSSIAEIAAGNIAVAAAAMEEGLARGLSLVISFLAALLRLNAITAKIRGALDKIRGKVDDTLAKVAKSIAAKAQKIYGKAKTAVGKVFNWGSSKAKFKDDEGHSHTIYVAQTGTPHVVIASEPAPAEKFLDAFLAKKSAAYRKDNEKKIQDVRKAAKVSTDVVNKILERQKKQPNADLNDLQQALLAANVALSEALRVLIDSDASIGKMKEKYLLEGLAGTYGSMPKPKGDGFTADHQPQAAILEAAAEFDYFSETGELAQRAAGRAKAGYAINVHYNRHIAGRTYGSKGKATKAAFLARIKPLVRNKKRAEQRAIVVGEVKNELAADVKAMRAAANPSSANWDDIRKASGKKEEKDKLIQEISTRIDKGEDQMAAQDLDSLAK